jgi:hypothetical protein
VACFVNLLNGEFHGPVQSAGRLKALKNEGHDEADALALDAKLPSGIYSIVNTGPFKIQFLPVGLIQQA